ncbi:MAG: Kelch repeat-containing protein [Planctomycetota bacterium]|jgi:hypothetical protein
MRTKLIATCLLLAGTAFAGEKLEVRPALAPDPEVGRLLAALGEGCSVVLPAFKVTGEVNDVARKWGLGERGPEGRDYCAKMLWMPGRKRAAFCGANHAYPHRLNDVWEYDLAANTWVCLYGPDMSKNGKPENWKDTVVDEKGVFRCKRGGPASIGHLWWQITYDPAHRRIVWMCCWGSSAPFAKALPAKMGGKLPDPPLWYYYPYERKWEAVTGSKIVGRSPGGANASALEYLPGAKKYLWMRVHGTWNYDPAADTWTEMKPNGGALKHGDRRSHAWEGVTAYVPNRKIVVSAGGDRPAGERKVWAGRTNVYDVRTDTWKRVAEGNGVPWASTAGTPIVYDSNADVCLFYHNRLKQFWAFDIDATKWTQITPKGPGLPGRIRPMSYYDPERNAWIIHRGNKVWAYRHKPRAKGK